MNRNLIYGGEPARILKKGHSLRKARRIVARMTPGELRENIGVMLAGQIEDPLLALALSLAHSQRNT